MCRGALYCIVFGFFQMSQTLKMRPVLINNGGEERHHKDNLKQ